RTVGMAHVARHGDGAAEGVGIVEDVVPFLDELLRLGGPDLFVALGERAVGVPGLHLALGRGGHSTGAALRGAARGRLTGRRRALRFRLGGVLRVARRALALGVALLDARPRGRRRDGGWIRLRELDAVLPDRVGILPAPLGHQAVRDVLRLPARGRLAFLHAGHLGGGHAVAERDDDVAALGRRRVVPRNIAGARAREERGRRGERDDREDEAGTSGHGRSS